MSTSDALSTEDVSPHRHSWKVLRYETTATGRLREYLRCKFCEAFKCRLVRVTR